MEKNYSLTLDKEFIEFCRLNNVENVEELAKKVFQKGFTIYKYGEKPDIAHTPSTRDPALMSKEEIVKNARVIDEFHKDLDRIYKEIDEEELPKKKDSIYDE